MCNNMALDVCSALEWQECAVLVHLKSTSQTALAARTASSTSVDLYLTFRRGKISKKLPSQFPSPADFVFCKKVLGASISWKCSLSIFSLDGDKFSKMVWCANPQRDFVKLRDSCFHLRHGSWSTEGRGNMTRSQSHTTSNQLTFSHTLPPFTTPTSSPRHVPDQTNTNCKKRYRFFDEEETRSATTNEGLSTEWAKASSVELRLMRLSDGDESLKRFKGFCGKDASVKMTSTSFVKVIILRGRVLCGLKYFSSFTERTKYRRFQTATRPDEPFLKRYPWNCWENAHPKQLIWNVFQSHKILEQFALERALSVSLLQLIV